MQEKVEKSPFWASLVVPLGVIVLASLIVWGVTRLLTVKRTHRDLVQELSSKTFGNRWVAAYELSKLLNRSRIPVEDIPWMIQQLKGLYQQSPDPRTRNFIILALGSLKDTRAQDVFYTALQDPDAGVQLNGVVALGNLTNNFSLKTEMIYPLLKLPDSSLVIAAVMLLAKYHPAEAQEHLLALLRHQSQGVRYAAATALIFYREEEALALLRDILSAAAVSDKEFQRNTQLNILKALEMTGWQALKSEVEALARGPQNAVQARALQLHRGSLTNPRN